MHLADPLLTSAFISVHSNPVECLLLQASDVSFKDAPNRVPKNAYARARPVLRTPAMKLS